MSIFRNFNKVINAERLTKPNNLLLSACYRPVHACSLNQPNIDHLNSLKDLFSTLRQIQSFNQNGNFKTIIEQQLQYLNKMADKYRVFSRKYTESGAKLNAQAIANLYACAQDLNASSEWLKNYVHDEIPHYLRFMSLTNLKDVEEGLKKYHPESEYSRLVVEQQSKRIQQNIEYVNYAPQQVGEFQEMDAYPSNNTLIRNYHSGSTARYYAEKALQGYWDIIFNIFHKKPYGYILHNSN